MAASESGRIEDMGVLGFVLEACGIGMRVWRLVVVKLQSRRVEKCSVEGREGSAEVASLERRASAEALIVRHHGGSHWLRPQPPLGVVWSGSRRIKEKPGMYRVNLVCIV
jgi:hypothetical protein